jgi:hypothetical protein
MISCPKCQKEQCSKDGIGGADIETIIKKTIEEAFV